MSKGNPNPKFSMLIDTTLCVGCEKCVDECKELNKTGRDRASRWNENSSDLSDTRYTTIIRKGDAFVRRSCRHCLEPACASACIVGALQHTDDGPTVYDKGKCMGCRYCMMACPFGIPRYEWQKAAPAIRKCVFCYEKIKNGEIKEPGCVSACPQKVTLFGTRNDMLAVAKERIDKNPGKYFNNHIYGGDEVGGTSVMLISNIDLNFLGWRPDMDKTPLPQLTWAALSKVPPVVLGMGAFATAAYWIIGRRMKLQQERVNAELKAEEVDKKQDQ